MTYYIGKYSIPLASFVHMNYNIGVAVLDDISDRFNILMPSLHWFPIIYLRLCGIGTALFTIPFRGAYQTFVGILNTIQNNLVTTPLQRIVSTLDDQIKDYALRLKQAARALAKQ
jgi:hypothetical protein